MKREDLVRADTGWTYSTRKTKFLGLTIDKAKVVPLNWVGPPGHNLVGSRGMHLWRRNHWENSRNIRSPARVMLSSGAEESLSGALVRRIPAARDHQMLNTY